MNNKFLKISLEADSYMDKNYPGWKDSALHQNIWKEVYGKIILQECIDEIESYQIPVGNSPAGELACEWTYDALKDIRQNIKEKFLIK